jgi:hypothetical protein
MRNHEGDEKKIHGFKKAAIALRSCGNEELCVGDNLTSLPGIDLYFAKMVCCACVMNVKD